MLWQLTVDLKRLHCIRQDRGTFPCVKCHGRFRMIYFVTIDSKVQKEKKWQRCVTKLPQRKLFSSLCWHLIHMFCRKYTTHLRRHIQWMWYAVVKCLHMILQSPQLYIFQFTRSPASALGFTVCVSVKILLLGTIKKRAWTSESCLSKFKWTLWEQCHSSLLSQ